MGLYPLPRQHFDWAVFAAGDKLLHISIAGLIDRFNAALPDDFAFMDHCHIIGDFAHRIHIVGDLDGGGPKGGDLPTDEIINHVGGDGVQTRGWLIKKHNFRAGDNGAGQANALLHAAG